MPGCSRTPAGRPQKIFSTCSSKTKKRRTQHLVEEIDEQELTYAAQVSLRTSGKRDAAQVLQQITETTPRRATKIKKAFQSSRQSWSEKPVPYTGDEALCLMVEAKLTKHQYLVIRSQAKERKADIYPSYHVILQSKRNCYPETITVTETTAEVKLQSLLDHTATRLVTVQNSVIQLVQEKSLLLISKWGCDGTTGQSEYKQRFKCDDDGTFEKKTDKDLFVTCLVPLQLTVVDHSNTDKNIIIWQNPRPSSTRFCRPIRFQFLKETTEVTVKEEKYIEDQIEELQPTKVSTGDKTEITIYHKLVMTMVDTKVCNAVTSTKSAQVCYICGATPKEMNNLAKVSEKAEDTSNFCFGLSTLHAWIRFFECLLHISYRLETKKWQVRGEEDKQKVNERKQVIVNKFRSEMGLLVDQPKSGGSGTTNDGNTARRFFAHSALSSAITGISKELIDRFGVILQALASGFAINLEAYDTYAMETARIFVELYPWYYMPASVHKIIIHGSQVISSSILPIGQLSEEAQEARNKDMKRFREAHTRKISREKTNEDLLHLLLISSDPIISSVRPLPTKKENKIPTEVLALLSPPPCPVEAANPSRISPDEAEETIENEKEKDETDDDAAADTETDTE